MRRVLPVPEYGGDGNDSLVLVVGQRDEYLHRAEPGILGRAAHREYRNEERGASQRGLLDNANHFPSPPLTSRNSSTAYRAPSGVSSCLK